MRNHEVLGFLQARTDSTSHVMASVSYLGRDILVSIDADGGSLDVALEFAAMVVNSLAAIEQSAKAIAVRDLLPIYNEDWNSYEIATEDGTLQSFDKGVLTPEEFASKLSISTIDITGSHCFDIGFHDDEHLFWGHQIFVESVNGLDLSSARAKLFG